MHLAPCKDQLAAASPQRMVSHWQYLLLLLLLPLLHL
jgi:hypothetical protein